MEELDRDCVQCEITALDLRSRAQSDNVNMEWQHALTSVRLAIFRVWNAWSVAEGIDQEGRCLFASRIKSEPLSSIRARSNDLNSSLGIMTVDDKIWFDGMLFIQPRAVLCCIKHNCDP